MNNNTNNDINQKTPKQNRIVKRMIELKKNTPYTPEEINEWWQHQFEIQNDPDWIDDYIYGIEHGYTKDFQVTFKWELYKMHKGYYDRHPERKEESQRWTFAQMGLPYRPL